MRHIEATHACLAVLLFALYGSFHAAILQRARPEPRILKQEIVSKGNKRTYYLFVPDGVSSANPAPLLVSLHGQGRTGSSLMEKWKNLAATEKIILVGPDALGSTWAIPEDAPEFLRDVIEEVKSKHPVQPRRMYLFGHSAGATTAIFLSLLESEYFAAAAIHAGALALPEDQQFLGYAKRKIPLAIFVGTQDPYFPLTNVRATRDVLAAQGIPVHLEEISGHNHDYYARSVEINRRAWSFLKEKELPWEPKYTQYR